MLGEVTPVSRHSLASGEPNVLCEGPELLGSPEALGTRHGEWGGTDPERSFLGHDKPSRTPRPRPT